MSIENKVLSSLAYLSVFFMPVIIPIIILALTINNYPEAHLSAKNAIWLHIAPWVLGVIVAGLIALGVNASTTNNSTLGIIWFVLAALFAILVLFLFCYNLYLGIKVWVQQ